MLLKLFKKPYFVQISWLIVFAVVFAVPDFLQKEQQFIPSSTIFTNSICFYSWFKINWLYQLVSHLLLLFLAFYLKEVFSKHHLVHHSNFLPSILLIALFNFSHPFEYDFLAIINLFLLTLAFDFMLKSGEDHEPDNSIFTSALLLSMASMISYSNLFIFPVIWITFFLFQNYSWRYFPMSIVGFLSPYLFLFVWLFWFDRGDLILAEWPLMSHDFFVNPNIEGLFVIIIFSFLVFFLILSMMKIIPETPGKVIAIRRKIRLSIWFLFFSIIPWLFFPDSISKNLFLVPLVGLLGYYLRVVKRRPILMDFIFTIFISLLLINKYYLYYASSFLFE